MYPETWKVIIFYYSSMQWQGEWQILNDICIKIWIKTLIFIQSSEYQTITTHYM